MTVLAHLKHTLSALYDRAASSLSGRPSEEELLRHSAYFDEDYYLASNPDVAHAGVPPIRHFLDSGAAEGRNPSVRFDTRFYLSHYPDVEHSGMNPLVHFLLHGMNEARITRPKKGPDYRVEHTEKVLAKWRQSGQLADTVTESLFGLADDSPSTQALHVFTAISSNYLPKARVLANSVKRHHPDWLFVVALMDEPPPGFTLAEEPFDRILGPAELGLDNWRTWAFRHRVVEICTACKAPAATQLLDEGIDKLIYLDPDTVVMNSLAPLEKLLDQHPVILTPHLLSAENKLDEIRDNEINILKHGIYNLGFFALRNRGQGRDFAFWWRKRLEHFCYIDYANGLFTDQRWCDLAPALFDELLILRDPGYNVATWNISHRPLSIDPTAGIRVNDKPLRFYHFTGYDSGWGIDAVRRYCATDAPVWALWDWYAKAVNDQGQSELGTTPWSLARFDNGNPITDEMRLLYRARKDLQQTYPDPFVTSHAGGGFAGWWEKYRCETSVDE